MQRVTYEYREGVTPVRQTLFVSEPLYSLLRDVRIPASIRGLLDDLFDFTSTKSYKDKETIVSTALHARAVPNYYSIKQTQEGPVVTFLAANQVPAEYSNTVWMRHNRQEMKLGRWLKRIVNVVEWSRRNISDPDVETFVNVLKAVIVEQKEAAPGIHEVTGREITEWYCSDRYAPGGGSIHSSCMAWYGSMGNKRGPAQYRANSFPCYEICEGLSMVIVVDDNNLLLGRALLWTPEEAYAQLGNATYNSRTGGYEYRGPLVKLEGLRMMDNAYVAKDYVYQMLTKYAQEKGYGARSYTFKVDGQNATPYFRVRSGRTANDRLETRPYFDSVTWNPADRDYYYYGVSSGGWGSLVTRYEKQEEKRQVVLPPAPTLVGTASGELVAV